MSVVMSEVVVSDLEGDQAEAIAVSTDRKIAHEVPPYVQLTDLTDQNNQQKFKKKLPETEALKLYQRGLDSLKNFGYLVGVNVHYEWKMNVRYFIMKFILWFAWSQIFYSQLLHIYNQNAMKNLEVFALYGVTISNSMNILYFEKYYRKIRALYESTMKLCRQSHGTREEKLRSRVQANYIFYKFMSFLCFIVFMIYVFSPVCDYVLNGKLEAFLPIEFMFVDSSTSVGFLIQWITQGILGLYSINIEIYMGFVFVFAIMDYKVRVDLVQMDFNELDDMWTGTSTTTLSHRHKVLRNICWKFIDMRRYIAEIKNIFDRKLFLFFVFAYFSQIISMYEIRVNNWIAGYAIAYGLFIEMIFLCLMGTQVTIDNERSCTIITQSNWYTYDAYSKKLILQLLNVAMNADELWIGPFKPLSIVTGSQIIRSIYTYYTVLMEML